MDVIADTVPAFITERDASGKADLEMSVAYLFDVCRLKPVTVPAGILDNVTCCRSDILFPFLPDYCNETVYLVRITLVYPIPAVMETVEALQAFHCIRSVNSIVFSIFMVYFNLSGHHVTELLSVFTLPLK